jgi:BlaR1 peptidase M56
METLFIYLVKSSGLIGLFYLAYILLLRKETFFNSNRWFLLAGLITSVILPLIVITKIVWVDPSPTDIDWSRIPVTNTVENEAIEINWHLVFGIIYLIGILVFLLKFAFDFYSLSKILKGKTIQHQTDFKLINVTENIAPFSYFNSIVYNSSMYSETELENILEHEKVHSSQNHTFDVLISRLFCVGFWFNPIVWMYKNAIAQNLEFIADSEASKIISDKKAYQLTLLKITTQENCVVLTNHFYQSLIKKRIVMLNKNQSNKRNSWKYLFVLPLLGAFVFFFQVKVIAQEKVAPKQEKETDPKIENIFTTLSKGKDIDINGEKSSQEELDKLNPNEVEKIDVARINSKEAILITPKQLNKPVKITDKDIYIDGVKSTSEEFSKLDQNTIDKVDVNTFENTVRITTKTINQSADNFNNKIISKEKPLIILNGKRTQTTFEDVNKLDPNLIQSINVLKGKKAIEKYGKDGENGVIEIITKENADLLKYNSPSEKKDSELDKSEIENSGSETVSSYKQYLEMYKTLLDARFSLERIKKQREQAKVELEKSRKTLKSKLFS